MATVTQKSTITDNNSGVIIGLSDTINNYTFDDLWDSAYAVAQFDELCNFLDRDTDTCLGLKQYLSGDQGHTPVEITKTHNGPAWDYAGVTYSGGTMQYNTTDGLFCRVIWLYSTGTANLPITQGNSTAKVITSLDMSKISLKMNDYGEASGTVAPFDDVTTWTSVKPISWTMQYNGTNMTESDHIYPYLMFKIGDRGYINRLFYKVSLTDYLFGVKQSYKDPVVWSAVYSGNKEVNNQIYTSNMVRTYETTDIVYKALALNVANTDTATSDFYKLPYTYNLYRSGWNPYSSYNTDTDGIGAYINFTQSSAGGITYGAFTHEKFKDLCSRIGVNFETDKKYKVIIKDGVVTGYTDNLSAESEIDTYTGNTKHDVPDTPPVRPDKDDIDSMDIDTSELGGAGIAGAVTYYTMTNVQLSSFMDELAEQSAEHSDIATGFVSASYIPNILDTAVRATSMPIRVKGVTTTATGNKVILQHSILIASVSVPRRHNNAYDTMTKYYLYTPYTDVIPLNYKCYGRTLKVYLLPSIQDCNADIVVQSDGVTIAKQTVSLGSALAISAENNAEKSTAIVNACSKYAVSAGGVIGGALTGNPIAVAGSAVGVVASTVNALNALGNSYIHSYGTTTGTTLSLNPRNIYVIEHVVQPDKPSNYARTNGNIVNMEMEITNGMGYTKLGNPRINTNLTAPEYAELINALENGVIL